MHGQNDTTPLSTTLTFDLRYFSVDAHAASWAALLTLCRSGVEAEDSEPVLYKSTSRLSCSISLSRLEILPSCDEKGKQVVEAPNKQI